MTKQKGGYTLVSLMFVDLALGGIIAGLGERLHSIGSKRVVLTDIVVSGDAKKEIPVQVDLELDYTEPEDDSEPEPIYKATIKGVYGYTLSITDGTLTTEAEKDALQLEEEIGALQTIVGDSDSGLVKDVADLQTTVAGKTDLTSVQSLIEGGTVSNAKPIYCHPLTIYSSTDFTIGEKDYSFTGTAMIFNNSSATISSWGDLYNASISFHRLQVNGILMNKTDNVAYEVVQLYVNPNSIRPICVNLSTGARYDESDSAFELFGHAQNVFDGANKIN